MRKRKEEKETERMVQERVRVRKRALKRWRDDARVRVSSLSATTTTTAAAASTTTTSSALSLCFFCFYALLRTSLGDALERNVESARDLDLKV